MSKGGKSPALSYSNFVPQFHGVAMTRTAILAMTLGVALSGPAIAIGANQQVVPNRNHFIATQVQSRGGARLETFTGRISNDGDEFILTDDSNKATYRLDDQQSAEKFAGKKVRVKGIFDVTDNTIRIQSIEIAA